MEESFDRLVESNECGDLRHFHATSEGFSRRRRSACRLYWVDKFGMAACILDFLRWWFLNLSGVCRPAVTSYRRWVASSVCITVERNSIFMCHDLIIYCRISLSQGASTGRILAQGTCFFFVQVRSEWIIRSIRSIKIQISIHS